MLMPSRRTSDSFQIAAIDRNHVTLATGLNAVSAKNSMTTDSELIFALKAPDGAIDVVAAGVFNDIDLNLRDAAPP